MELSFEWDDRAGIPVPGQFFTVRVSSSFDPLLRRPFAFSGFGGGTASAIYQVRGPATGALASLSTGAGLDVVGPLGRGFPDPGSLASRRALAVSGGIGLGPMLFLVHELGERKIATRFVAGFRTASSIPDIQFPGNTQLCTDDGTRGHAGSTVDWVRSIETGGVEPVLFACGPGPMLAALAGLAEARAWTAFFSAEQRMACGVGACMGCVVRARDGGFLRVCADGPVFDARAIAWETGR